MNDNNNQSSEKDKSSHSGSYFIIAQILASLAIIFGAHYLKITNPTAYSEVKDWYNHNINYKNFDTSALKSKALDATNKISESAQNYLLTTLSFLNK